MNERIRELADKIWEEEYWLNPNTDKLLPAQLQKFAELIVKECMSMCQTAVGNADYNTGRLHCLENIKEHFGIE